MLISTSYSFKLFTYIRPFYCTSVLLGRDVHYAPFIGEYIKHTENFSNLPRLLHKYMVDVGLEPRIAGISTHAF